MVFGRAMLPLRGLQSEIPIMFSLKSKFFLPIQTRRAFSTLPKFLWEHEGSFDLNCVSNHLRENGFVVFSGDWVRKTPSYGIAKKFGLIQKNKSTNNDNVAIVSAKPIESDVVRGVYSAGEFFPHTDGPYLQGIEERQGIIRGISPPKFILLKCIDAAESGGETILVDGKKALLEALNNYPQIIGELFDSNSKFFLGNGVMTSQSVFKLRSDGSIQFNYSNDSNFILTEKSKVLVDIFDNNCLEPSHEFKLNSGEVLLIDNYRILHGRNKFSGSRVLERVWIQDEETVSKKYVRSKPKSVTYYSLKDETSYALEAHAHFGIVNDFNQKVKKTWETGIHLEQCDMRRLVALLEKTSYDFKK